MTTRIFQSIPLSPNALITLDEQASHHLARVLRCQQGELVVIFNGQGGEYTGKIVEIGKKQVTVQLHAYTDADVESPLDIWLAQGISRGEKMDYTIQKAVELGVNKIIPLFTERCNVKLDSERSEKRLQHWQSIVISACEQSGRNRVPEVIMPQTLKSWVVNVDASHRFVLSPYAVNKLKNQTISVADRVILLMGPEGGLSENEIEYASAHDFLPLNLGPRILRTETAAVAAITALQCQFGDMG